MTGAGWATSAFLLEGRWSVSCYCRPLGAMRPQARGKMKAKNEGGAAEGRGKPGCSRAWRSKYLLPEIFGEKKQNRPLFVVWATVGWIFSYTQTQPDTPCPPNETSIRTMPNPGTSCTFLICLSWWAFSLTWAPQASHLSSVSTP